MCLLFLHLQGNGWEHQFHPLKGEYEESGRSMVWSSALGVGLFLLLCPVERLSENVFVLLHF